VRASLAGGAQRVGWKLGMGDRERIGAGPVIGHLTTATLLTAGATFRAAGIAAPHAHVGVVATHVFHRAVAFAPVTCAQMATDVSGQLVVGGTVRD
jgi:hypothetical protein